jgi:hypothetical protein
LIIPQVAFDVNESISSKGAEVEKFEKSVKRFYTFVIFKNADL